MPYGLLRVSAALMSLAITAGTGDALAGPLSDAAGRAEQLATLGDPVAARDAIRDAYGTFASTLPFSIGKAVFVDQPPAGYGMYDTRPSSTFAAGEALTTYVEPVGLSWRDAGGGKLESQFTVDLELRDTKGELLAEQKAFGSFAFKGHVRNQEIFAKLTLNLDEAPAGDYVLRYRFRDTISGAVALSDQTFSIAAAEVPAAEPAR